MNSPIEHSPSPQNPNDPNVSTTLTTLIYILFLAGLVIPFASLIAVIMAYVNKGDAPTWLQTHYQFQIRTFWIGLLYTVIGVGLTVILIGYLVLLFVIIWLIIRCVKGLKTLNNKTPIAQPTSWMFG